MALRMRVSMSAIGSVSIFGAYPVQTCPVQIRSLIRTKTWIYQLALRTPGIKPWSANLRKQIRQMPNFRYTARGRPHMLQRRLKRVVNFGACLALANLDLLATNVSLD